MQNITEFKKARAIFYDIAEAMHQQQNLGEKWRAAWVEGANARPTRQAVAAGSSRPAARHPASGGEGSSPPQPLALTAPGANDTAGGESPKDASSGAASVFVWAAQARLDALEQAQAQSAVLESQLENPTQAATPASCVPSAAASGAPSDLAARALMRVHGDGDDREDLSDFWELEDYLQ